MALASAYDGEHPQSNITTQREQEAAVAGNDATAADHTSVPTSEIHNAVCMCTSIGLGTILGLLSRTGIIIVSNELLKTELSGIVWSNFIACFCMGVFVKTFSAMGLSKDHVVYLGLTTGYCGTFSSFSSAALEIFNTAAGRNLNQPPSTSTNTTVQYHPETYILVLRNLSNFAGITFVHIGVSFIGYHIGCTTSIHILQDSGSKFLEWCRRNSLVLKITSISIPILILISSLLETYILRSFNFFIYVCFASVFALPGTGLRYFLSKLLNFDKRNNRKRIFPLGTFIANALGSVVLSISTLLTLGIEPNHSPNKDSWLIKSEIYCCILSAVGLGFCGALTTMSTFISELSTATKPLYMYTYAVSSVLVTVGSFVVIWGTYSWSVGYALKSSCL